MKLTENKLESLIDALNVIICDEVSITREQRENMVRTVATLGGLSERQRLIAAGKDASTEAREENPKKFANPIWYFREREKRGFKRTLTSFIPLLMTSRMKVLTTTFCGYQSSRVVHPMPSH